MKRVSRVSAALVAVLALTLAGCSGDEPEEPAPSTTPPIVEPTAEPTPEPTTEPPAEPEPPAEIALPAECTDIFDDAFIAEMEGYHLPLNDPGISMPSTELLETGSTIISTEPSLRCTWGYPSEVGIATTVALITEAQRADILAEAEDRGFTCDVYPEDETRCNYEEYHEDEDFGPSAFGEEHSLRGNAWVATHWLNVEVPNYTDRIVAALWD